MKKLYAALTVCALALSLGVTALAQGKMGAKGSKKTNCCCSTKGDATPEQIKKFKSDTIDLRQEMMNKRFDLQRESLKEIPDSAKTDGLKAEIDAIKTKIEAVRESSKLPESVCHKVCQMMGDDGSNCNKAGSCGCKECRKGKACSDCSKCKDCSCKDCNKGKPRKHGCKGDCNTKPLT